MIALFAGLGLGLASSVHCALMCGPLMGLIGGRRDKTTTWRGVRTQIAGTLWHHGGRVFVYVVLGALAGHTEVMLKTQGLRSTLAIAAGLAVIITAIVSQPVNVPSATAVSWSATIGSWIGRLSARLPRQQRIGRLAVGVLHGFLPCGLLYVALVAAAGFGNRAAATTFMLGFGLATIPALAGIGSVLAVFQRAPAAMRRAAPVATALVGLLLVARGIGVPGIAEHGAHSITHAHRADR